MTDLGFVVTSDLLAQEVHALIKEPVVKLQSTWRGTRVRLALYLWSRASRDVLPPETCQPGKVASSSGEERGKGQKLPTVDSFSSAPISSGGSKSTESRNGDLVVVGTSPSLELCPLVRTQLDLVRCASSESEPVGRPEFPLEFASTERVRHYLLGAMYRALRAMTPLVHTREAIILLSYAPQTHALKGGRRRLNAEQICDWSPAPKRSLRSPNFQNASTVTAKVGACPDEI